MMFERDPATNGERVEDIVPTVKYTQRESPVSQRIGKDLCEALRTRLSIVSR